MNARASATLSLAALGACAVGMGVAVAVYPGGSWADASTPGFDWLRNYWCDLMRSTGMNGEPNAVGELWSKGAFLAIALSTAALWHAAGVLLDTPAAAQRLRLVGWTSALGIAAMVAWPYEHYRVVHTVTVLLGGGAAVAAMALVALGRARRASALAGAASRAWWLLTAGLLLSSAVNIVVYVDLGLRGADGTFLAQVQKLVTLFLLPWMAATAMAARSASTADPGVR